MIDGTCILWHRPRGRRGAPWQRLFRGTYDECRRQEQEFMAAGYSGDWLIASVVIDPNRRTL